MPSIHPSISLPSISKVCNELQCVSSERVSCDQPGISTRPMDGCLPRELSSGSSCREVMVMIEVMMMMMIDDRGDDGVSLDDNDYRGDNEEDEDDDSCDDDAIVMVMMIMMM